VSCAQIFHPGLRYALILFSVKKVKFQ